MVPDPLLPPSGTTADIPSIIISLVSPREPFTEKLFTRLKGWEAALMSRCGFTPADISPRYHGIRVRMGSSSTCFRVITWPVAAEAVSSSGASPFTCTVSVRLPTCSIRSTLARWFKSRLMPVRSSF